MKKLSLPVQASIALVIAIVVCALTGVWLFLPGVFFISLFAMGYRKAKKMNPVSPAEREAALSLQSAPGLGRVIVYRESLAGLNSDLDVAVDGSVVVRLVYRCSTSFDLQPGSHVLKVSTSDPTWASGPSRELPFTLAAGEAVVIRTGLAGAGVVLERDADPVAAAARLKGRIMVRVEAPAI